MRVNIVGDHGPEHNSIRSIHKTYKGTLKAWNTLRQELLDNAKSMLDRNPKKNSIKKIYERIINNLSCEEPEKIDNYPQETPYIQEYEVED